MKEYLCLNIEEATAEVEACKAFVAECQQQLSDAKAALRSAERELRDWHKGIVQEMTPEEYREVVRHAQSLVQAQYAMGAAVGA